VTLKPRQSVVEEVLVDQRRCAADERGVELPRDVGIEFTCLADIDECELDRRAIPAHLREVTNVQVDEVAVGCDVLLEHRDEALSQHVLHPAIGPAPLRGRVGGCRVVAQLVPVDRLARGETGQREGRERRVRLHSLCLGHEGGPEEAAPVDDHTVTPPSPAHDLGQHCPLRTGQHPGRRLPGLLGHRRRGQVEGLQERAAGDPVRGPRVGTPHATSRVAGHGTGAGYVVAVQLPRWPFSTAGLRSVESPSRENPA
jgi:hypothetical protein